MSFLKHFFPEDFAKAPRAVASPRVRTLKGFEPHQVAALQDPHITDDPTFWILTVVQAANVAGNSAGGVQVPNDPNLIVTVDAFIADIRAATDYIQVDVVLGGQAPAVFTSDQNVWKKNRRESATTTAVEKAGLLRIFQNIAVITGTQIAHAFLGTPTALVYPLGYRLFANEQLFVHTLNLNEALDLTMWGRMEAKRR